MEDTHRTFINFAIANTIDYGKKKLEPVSNFGKEDIALTFVEVDGELADNKTGHLATTIQQIRDKLFQLYNLCCYGLNVRKFASHKPGDRTPLDGGC